MKMLPIIRGVIARRILVNFRADPESVRSLLPWPFRPKLVNGYAMVGICLIGLRQIRPAAVRWKIGVCSENAAHRIAVEWTDRNEHQGVYIPRRDTSSLLQALAGGRVFPGVHHWSTFHVADTGATLEVRMRGRDGTYVLFAGDVFDSLPPASVFGNAAEASEFFRQGSLGYSDRAGHMSYDGLELRSLEWKVRPLRVTRAESSFLASLFPEGSLEFDCALLMRNLEHEWHSRGTLSPTATLNERDPL